MVIADRWFALHCLFHVLLRWKRERLPARMCCEENNDDYLSTRRVWRAAPYHMVSTGLSLSVALATYNGERYLGEQLLHHAGTSRGSCRKLPSLRDKQEVELSGKILAGGSNEEISIYGKPDCWDIEGSEQWCCDQRDLAQA